MSHERRLTGFQRHPLIRTLLTIRGNQRACVYTEPLWGIPFNLYSPFLTVYMYALGVKDVQIGIIMSIGMALQVLAAFFGGILTDRFGRRLTTFIVDLIGWTIPTLLWAFSQNFWWFVAAVAFNSLFQITSNSWVCLMVEDCEPDKLVHIFTWCTISGLLAVFFAPLSGFLVSEWGVIPAMRLIMLFTCLMMTSKFVLLYIFSKETTQGLASMKETKGKPLSHQMRGYGHLMRVILTQPNTLLILMIMILLNITTSVTGSFFALYATENLGIGNQFLAYFPMVRAIVMLAFIFSVQTLMNRLPFRIPILTGLILYIASQLMLILTHAGNWPVLIGYILCEAFAHALVVPQKDSLLVMFVDPVERARMTSLIYIFMLGLSSPFGWIAGLLSHVDRRLPFLLNIVLYAACASLVMIAGQKNRSKAAA